MRPERRRRRAIHFSSAAVDPQGGTVSKPVGPGEATHHHVSDTQATETKHTPMSRGSSRAEEDSCAPSEDSSQG